MKKIHNEPKHTHIRRPLAFLLAAVLALGASALAVTKWTGYAETGGMSRAEKTAFIKEATRTSVVSEDKSGNVTYYDAAGKPIMTLTAEENAAYERERAAAQEKAVIESASLVDASTISLLPKSITEVAVDADGRFPDCALGNGSMLVLHPDGAEGWTLQCGDTVTVSLDASEVCYLQFGFFRDGVFTECETLHEESPSYTFTLPEDGVYCFSAEYFSAGADFFANGRLKIG